MLKLNFDGKVFSKAIGAVLNTPRRKRSPLEYLPLLFSLIVIIYIVWSTVEELAWYRLRIPVTFMSTHLQVGSLDSSNYLSNYLQSCERIVAVGNLPARVLGTNRLDPDQNAFVNTLEDVSARPLETSLKEGQLVQFWSTRSETLTLDISQCKDYNTAISRYLAQNGAGKCPNCLTPASLQSSEGSVSLITLNLAKLKLFSGEYVFIIILTLLVLSFCLIGFYFNWRHSNSLIIAINNLLLTSSALVLLAHNSSYYQISPLDVFVRTTSFQLTPILFLHFVLIFPDGKTLTVRARRSLYCSYFGSGLVLALALYTDLFSKEETVPEFLKSLARSLRYLNFVLLFSVGIVILVVSYFRSKSDLRLRLHLAISSIILSVSFPLISFIGNAFFGLWQDWIEQRFVVFLLPSVVIPIFFVYAVIKNKLFGVEVRIRRFVAYWVVIIAISVVYYITSVALTIFLPFEKSLDSSPVFNIIYLVALTELIHLFFGRIQKFVDKQFNVDPLNYQALRRYWLNELAKTQDLESICRQVTGQLASDYHYKFSSLFLCQPKFFNFPTSHHSGSPAPGTVERVNSSADPALLPALLLSSSAVISAKSVKPEFWDYLKTQDWVVAPHNNEDLPTEFISSLTVLQLPPVEVILPLKLANEFYGVVLLGEKTSEYSPPPQDELEQLKIITSQIAAALHHSLLLAEAQALAEKEKRLRLESQSAAKKEQAIRQQTLSSVADAIHGEPLQDLFVLRQKLERLRLNGAADPTVAVDLTDFARDVDTVIKDFRVITAQLRLFGEAEGFLSIIEKLVAAFRAKYSEQQLNLELLCDQEELLNSLLTDDLKFSLFLVIQEAINNALKYSGGSTIDVYLEFSQAHRISSGQLEPAYLFEINISDDGVGVSQEQLNKFNSKEVGMVEQLNGGKQQGLRMIKQRIEQYAQKYNSQLTFYSSPGAGFQVAIVLYLTGPVEGAGSFPAPSPHDLDEFLAPTDPLPELRRI